MVNNHYRWDFIGLSTDTKPTPATSEKVVNGSTFYCSDTSKLYVFYKDTWYERQPLGGGGGGGTTYTAGDGIDITNDTISVKLAQTTGTSTTDVMSQKAVTDAIFRNNDTSKIQIGNSSYASGTNAVAIGKSAIASASNGIGIGNNVVVKGNGNIGIGCNAAVDVMTHKGSVALGYGAVTTSSGQVFIGSTTSSDYGYNNSNYRLLSGVHDGQTAHDAATVAQVNATIDAINTALSTSIPHIGATS